MNAIARHEMRHARRPKASPSLAPSRHRAVNAIWVLLQDLDSENGAAADLGFTVQGAGLRVPVTSIFCRRPRGTSETK